MPPDDDDTETTPVSGKSVYVLELSVQPGGSRWAELHAYTEVGHLKLWLEDFCRGDPSASAYHAISYGATLAIWVVQKGVVTKVIDLHPHLRAILPGGEIVQLNDKKRLTELSAAQNDDGGFEYFEKVKLESFWDPVEERLPPLEPPLLVAGEELAVANRFALGIDTYLEDHVQHGSYDAEQGEVLTPPWERE